MKLKPFIAAFFAAILMSATIPAAAQLYDCGGYLCDPYIHQRNLEAQRHQDLFNQQKIIEQNRRIDEQIRRNDAHMQRQRERLLRKGIDMCGTYSSWC